jgi:hypothetical protein
MAYPDLQDVLDAIREDDNIGFCIECAAPVPYIEQYDRREECPHCGASAVYGASLCLLQRTCL